jgi:hypothetical protein
MGKKQTQDRKLKMCMKVGERERKKKERSDEAKRV